MDIGRLSTYLCLLQLLSSQSYSFQCRDTSPLVKCILKYFVFNASMNGTVSFISLLAISLLTYRKATDFCMFILYPADVLNSFLGLRVFGGVFRVFYLWDLITCKQTILFLFFFFNLDPFSFLFLPHCSG